MKLLSLLLVSALFSSVPLTIKPCRAQDIVSIDNNPSDGSLAGALSFYGTAALKHVGNIQLIGNLANGQTAPGSFMIVGHGIASKLTTNSAARTPGDNDSLKQFNMGSWGGGFSIPGRYSEFRLAACDVAQTIHGLNFSLPISIARLTHADVYACRGYVYIGANGIQPDPDLGWTKFTPTSVFTPIEPPFPNYHPLSPFEFSDVTFNRVDVLGGTLLTDNSGKEMTLNADEAYALLSTVDTVPHARGRTPLAEVTGMFSLRLRGHITPLTYVIHNNRSLFDPQKKITYYGTKKFYDEMISRKARAASMAPNALKAQTSRLSSDSRFSADSRFSLDYLGLPKHCTVVAYGCIVSKDPLSKQNPLFDPTLSLFVDLPLIGSNATFRVNILDGNQVKYSSAPWNDIITATEGQFWTSKAIPMPAELKALPSGRYTVIATADTVGLGGEKYHSTSRSWLEIAP